MAKKKRFVRKGVYLPMLAVVVILTCIGLVMVFSASYNSIAIRSDTASVFSGVKWQALVAAVGFILIFFMSKLDYHFFAKPRVLTTGFVIAIILLIAVFFCPSVYDAHRWISHKSLPVTFQSSEFAKFVGIIYAAVYTSKNKWWYRSLNDWIRLLLPIGVIGVLIIAEPDLSTTLCYLGAVTIILLVSGMPIRFFVIALCAMAALIPVMIAIKGYQSRRFAAWLHAWDDPKDVGYQVVQSLYAIGDGGLFGVGLGNSKQKITHLPMSDTDYIFAIICEEFGFVGAVIVVLLYVAFAFFGIKIAMEAADKFGAYLAAGITTIIVLQAFVNMGVATNALPSTGLTLPFISKGASSLLIMLWASGMLLSISAYKKRPDSALKEQK